MYNKFLLKFLIDYILFLNNIYIIGVEKYYIL